MIFSMLCGTRTRLTLRTAARVMLNKFLAYMALLSAIFYEIAYVTSQASSWHINITDAFVVSINHDGAPDGRSRPYMGICHFLYQPCVSAPRCVSEITYLSHSFDR